MRLILAPLAALLVLPVLPVAPALAADGPVRVTAVVRDAQGHLSFRQARAGDALAGRALAGRWRHSSGVVAADVEHRVRVKGTPDPLAPQQWGLTTLRASAVGVATGQVVGIIDTGVDAAHPDLAGVVLPGTDIVSPGGDGRTDPNGHGTHVAGIVAGVAGNGIGGAGLAQGAQLLPVRVIGADGTGWDGDAAKGVVWAVDHGATVVNLSFGGPNRSAVMDAAVSYALGKGVAVVVAAGNSATATSDPVQWPAADPGVIAVGAVDQSGVRPSWSSTGPYLALTAPGVGILSTVPITATNPSGYATWSGTSMAAPFVTASVALLRHAQPSLTVDAVRQRLMDTADDLGPIGFDNAYGAGRVDPAAAEGLPAATAPSATAPSATSPSATSPSATSPSPSAAPTSAPSSAPIPAPVVSPSPSALPTSPAAPVITARVSASRTTVAYTGPVTVSARVLVDGLGQPGQPLRIERLVGTSWLPTRTGTSGAAGLVSWVVRPDQTADFRAVGDGWSSGPVRVTVRPVLTAAAGRTGSGVLLSGRLLPATTTYVRIQRQLSTGWLTFASTVSGSDGTFRWLGAVPIGWVVRAYAAGVVSSGTRV